MENERKEYLTIVEQIRRFLNDRFNLDDDKAEQAEVIENIKKGVEFRGTNLWILMFAIVIASVGLNVNSTAVIIGAMLVSPLMGPIMGIGLALGINDFELIKKSFRSFIIAVGISLVVSTLYFAISPSLTTQSELLARTTPTIWDVLIATFGGLAGIVAQSRKDRTSTVIPGVAIATALMPPLCTAGFGLASGNWAYFLGALYLFTINAVFIALSTFFMVRAMKYEKKQFLDPKREKRVKQYVVIIITATLVPSVIIAYSVVQRAVFESNAQNFVKKALIFEGTEVMNSTINYNPKGSSIDVMLIGEPVAEDHIRMVQNQLPLFNIENTQLTIRQASSGDKLDNSQMQHILLSNTEIINEKNAKIAQLESHISRLQSRSTLPSEDIAREMSSLWSGMKAFSLSKAYTVNEKGKNIDSVLVCIIAWDHKDPVSEEDNQKITKWLSARTKTKNVKLILEQKETKGK